MQAGDQKMGIVLLTSTSGSPGVTTLAVGMALTWPRPILLADCDPGAHQAVLAGYLGGRSAGGRGLLRVAEAHRDRRPLREAILDQTLPLSAEGESRRLFLPGFTKPGSAAHFGGVWEDLAEAFDRLGEVDIDVIIDCGRLVPQGLPTALLERSAVTLVVVTSTLRSIMSARVNLPSLRDHPRLTSTDRGHIGLIVVGEGQPYGRGEIAKALDVPVLANVAHDPKAAAHLSDGRPRSRRFDSSPLIRSIGDASSQLSSTLQRSADLVGG
jgi:MinD-like ATPase involved in chromosome partitioning or flagellar assembly